MCQNFEYNLSLTLLGRVLNGKGADVSHKLWLLTIYNTEGAFTMKFMFGYPIVLQSHGSTHYRLYTLCQGHINHLDIPSALSLFVIIGGIYTGYIVPYALKSSRDETFTDH